MNRRDDEPADKSLSSIRVLYCENDTLALWGIPYDMRPGQQPDDLLRADRRQREQYDPRLLQAKLRDVKSGWIWLGSPGWWGHLSPSRQSEIREFLAAHKDCVPNSPNEWCPINEVT